MKKANIDYVEKEVTRQNFIKVGLASFAHYKETGQHITLDEFSSWVGAVQQNPDIPAPACHT
jgi:predicted transcriptional regulator